MIQNMPKITPIIVKILLFNSISTTKPAMIASVKTINVFMKYCFLAAFEKNKINDL